MTHSVISELWKTYKYCKNLIKNQTNINQKWSENRSKIVQNRNKIEPQTHPKKHRKHDAELQQMACETWSASWGDGKRICFWSWKLNCFWLFFDVFYCFWRFLIIFVTKLQRTNKNRQKIKQRLRHTLLATLASKNNQFMSFFSCFIQFFIRFFSFLIVLDCFCCFRLGLINRFDVDAVEFWAQRVNPMQALSKIKVLKRYIY